VSGGAVIRAAHYDQTVNELMADQVAVKMAAGLLDTPLADMVDSFGAPRHEFMLAALDEYHRRDGKVATHIGGVAEALLKLLDRSHELFGKVARYPVERDLRARWAETGGDQDRRAKMRPVVEHIEEANGWGGLADSVCGAAD
jgi:hypothetical protein